VFLYDLDDLRTVSEANARERQREAEAAEAVVAAAVTEYSVAHDAAAPLVAQLRRRAEEIRREELGRARARLGTLTAEQEAALEAATRAIVNKVLHVPTSQLRCLGRGASRQELRLAGYLLGVG
jgi:glutamyl-tRNA reductase